MPDKSLLQTGRFTEYFNQLENLKNTKVDQYDKQFKLTSSSISIHDLIIEVRIFDNFNNMSFKMYLIFISNFI